MNRYNSTLGINRRHDGEERFFADNHHHHQQHAHAPRANRHSSHSSQSPLREERNHNHHVSYDLPVYNVMGYDPIDQETSLRMKWTDNSPRMSRLRDHRQKRLVNKLEQFELWDMEQEHKQKQFEQARDQRYKNIMDRLKCQEFCVNLMKKRHESDIETSRELDTYGDSIYSDDSDPKHKYHGTMHQYRKFQYDMDSKLKTLQQDLDQLNPRYKIEQAILPRLERTRQIYSVEPEIYTHSGKRVNRKPNLSGVKYYYPSQPVSSYTKLLKPIIHSNQSDSVNEKALAKMKLTTSSAGSGQDSSRKVNFNDDVEYSEKVEASSPAGEEKE